MPYCTRVDAEKKWGKENIRRWADLDNDNNAVSITAVIDSAILDADSEVNDELRGGLYTVPFVSPYPRAIVAATASLVGAILYHARAVDDTEETTGFSDKRRGVLKWLREVKAGVIRLDAPRNVVTNYPSVVPFVTLTEEDTALYGGSFP